LDWFASLFCSDHHDWECMHVFFQSMAAAAPPPAAAEQESVILEEEFDENYEPSNSNYRLVPPCHRLLHLIGAIMHVCIQRA
jgi:hypothetical protein